jgi:hypothetical protein
MTYYIQIDDEVREATIEEIDAIQNHQASVAQAEAQEEAQKQAKQLAISKLAALGLTPDEAKLLLG